MCGIKCTTMKKILITLVMAVISLLPAGAEGLLDNLVYNLRFGYGIGGSSPVGMPSTIRSLDAYRLEPNFTLGLGVYKHLDGKWGLTTGLYLENKGMNVEATVKNYHMAIVRGGQRLEGNFTGHNTIESEQWMLTLPLLATYSVAGDVNLKLGPYFSYVRSHKFSGYAYDGYLRVGDPTGTKVEMGSEEGNRGTYDFSDNMRSWQTGLMLGVDWYFYKQWGAFADLSWGLSGIFHSSFNTIEQTLYPIYGTIGITYKLK